MNKPSQPQATDPDAASAATQSEAPCPSPTPDSAPGPESGNVESSAAESGVPAADPGEARETGEIQDLPAPTRSPLMMSRDDTALLVVDLQQKLVPLIRRHEIVAWNARRLVEGARILGVPRMCTEQYPQGLGNTIHEIGELLDVDDEKVLFSCRDCPTVARRLEQSGIQKVLLCGIESHVCVQQTALDFLAAGLDVWIACDATGSRQESDHDIALRRMESAGVTLTTTEAALFEWCEVAGTPEFKRISRLVREEPPAVSDSSVTRFFPRTGPRYLLQTDHTRTPAGDNQSKTELRFIVRHAETGAEVGRYEGSLVTADDDPGQVLSSEGITALDIGSDGTSLNLQHADGRIGMIYLPVGQPRSSHPRWKVRRLERHINSPEYQTDYAITFQVIEYVTGNVFREFHGFEHRDPSGEGFTHVSGVRQVEISADGRWLVMTEVGRPSELMALPPE